MLVEEFFAAVTRELPRDDPMRPAIEALPRPVAYMNPDAGHGRAVLTEWAVNWLGGLVSEKAKRDPAFNAPQSELEALDRRLGIVEDAQAAER